MIGGYEMICVIVGTCQLWLLSVVFMRQPYNDDTFVSTELMRDPPFSLALTFTVVFQIASCAVYTTIVGGKQQRVAVAVGSVSSIAALCGWTVLASWNLNSGSHAWGVALFIVGSVGYSLAMIAADRSVSRPEVIWIFAAIYTVEIVPVIVFIGCYLAGNVPVSIAAEWVGCMYASAAYIIFFLGNAMRQW